MSDVELEYAVRASDGELVHVDVVPRGAECGCVCPECGRPLIARQGKILAHCFAHEADPDSEAPCSGAFETATHRQGSVEAGKLTEILLPPLMAKVGGRSQLAIAGRRIALDPAQAVVNRSLPCDEPWHRKLRPDALVHSATDGALSIEVYVSHRVPAAKLDELRQRDLNVLEIDLSGQIDISPASVRQALLDEAPREWLHHREQARVDREFAAELAALAERQRRIAEQARRDAEERQRLAQEAEAKLVAEREARLRIEAEQERQRLAAWEAGRVERERLAKEQAAEIAARAAEAKRAMLQEIAEQQAELARKREAALARVAEARDTRRQIMAEAPRSNERVAYLRDLPHVAIPTADWPRCRRVEDGLTYDCHTPFLWRGVGVWRCLTCDPPPYGVPRPRAVRATLGAA